MRIPERARARSTIFVTLALAALLGSCGDDDGSNPPQNGLPVFTSASAVSVSESQSGVFYTATASDPDGDSLTFTLSGGTDVAQFQISASGALSFRAQPDFEAPADADRNNVYLVQIGVSDGTATASLALAVTVTDSTSGNFRVTRVGRGFDEPLYAVGIPDSSGRLFVVERTGRIKILTPDTGRIENIPFLDISTEIAIDGERGLLGFAPAPDFVQSGTVYVYLTNMAGDIELRRYRTRSSNPDQIDSGSSNIIMTFSHQFSNHNGGWIDFGPDGLLYIASGDGGGTTNPNNTSQNPSSLLGKILRIDVARDDFPNDTRRDYAIPSGNPFAVSGGAPEVWLYGLRNPFRNGFDRITGNLWIGDVGDDDIEEIDLARPADGGVNFGWPRFEGTQGSGSGAGLTFPVAEYSHGAGQREGDSVTGGYVYRGPVESLQGLYIFGDFVSGHIWSAPIARLVLGMTLPSSEFTIQTQAFEPASGTIDNISSFGQDQFGNLYIVDFDGEVFRVEPRP